MSPSVDIKTARSMKRSLEEAGPPSPIDIDTPEEDQEEQEEKKKKKKKKKREEEREVSQCVKRKIMEDEGSEVMVRETKRKKTGEEEDVANGGEEKKRKKKKKTVVDETIVVVEENLVSEGVEKKKKKKKKKVGADTREGVGEDVVNGAEEKKTVVEETIEVLQENLVRKDGEKKKKKKKKKEVIDETIVVVEENLVSEGVEKKKKKKQKVGADTREGVGEDVVNGGEEKKTVVEETIEVLQENLVNEGGEKQKKKKKKKKEEVIEETMEVVEHNLVNEGGESKKKKRKKGVKPEAKGGGEELPESRAVAELNEDGEATTGTTQEAEKKKKKKRVISDGQRKVDHCLPEHLLDCPDVREILEFLPNVRSRIVIEKFRRYDLHRFREFKKQGIPLRRGRCTDAEKQQMKKNVNDFLALTGISSAQELFYPQRSKDRSKEIKKLRVQHCFMEKMGEGLRRPCLQVYNLVRKMMDELNHMGRFNDEEIHMLQRLQTRHGNDWGEIAKSMDRSVYALSKRFAHIASQHGAWESDEEGRLMPAVRAHLETLVGPHQTGSASGPWLTREQLSKNLPWTSISKKVETRCWSQCREKWFTLLKSKMSSDQCPAFSGGVKAIKAKVKLIDTLYNMDVEDPALIDWDEVAITIGEVSDYYVRKSFYALKVSCVPRISQLSYPEIIDYLQEKVLPKLEEHLKEAGDTDLPSQDKYFLSRIFSSGEVDPGM